MSRFIFSTWNSAWHTISAQYMVMELTERMSDLMDFQYPPRILGTVPGHCSLPLPPRTGRRLEGTSFACFRNHSAQSLGWVQKSPRAGKFPFLPLPSEAPGAGAHWGRGREGALEGCLTWHFPVNLMEHSPVPVSRAVNTLGSEKTTSGHPPNTKPQKFFLLGPFRVSPEGGGGVVGCLYWHDLM